jgi:hypothetical protein
MEYWDFLLQKEGDRSWLPLESPDVEILEGRYRVVARSSRVNVSVEICVSHYLTVEDPPKRRVQVRSSQTNRDGLVVVMPFTRLQPGVWELRCRGDLMSDMLGKGWQSAVQLQVFSQEPLEEWHPEWQSAEQLPSEISQPTEATDAESYPVISSPAPVLEPTAAILEPTAAIASPEPEPAEQHLTEDVALPEPLSEAMASTIEVDVAEYTSDSTIDPAIRKLLTASHQGLISNLAEQLSGQLVDSLFQELDQSAEPVGKKELTFEPIDQIASTDLVEDLAETSFPYRLVLEQDTYIIQRGQVLRLKGQIERRGASEAAPDFEGEIRICLRDPQRSFLLAEARHLVMAQVLPLAFDYMVTTPSDYQTHLLLGEATLYTDSGAAIATASFTATTELDELLKAIASEPSGLIQPPLEFAGEPTPSLNLAFLDLLANPTSLPQFQPSLQQSLPPQLYQPDPARAKPKSLQLPFAVRSPKQSENLTGIQASIQAEMPPASQSIEVEPAVRESVVEAPSFTASEPPSELASNSKSQAPPTLEDSIDTVPDLSPDLPLEWQTADQLMRLDENPGHLLAHPATPEDAAFHSLNLKQRFWSRLNALAGDAELSTWLESSDPTQPHKPGEHRVRGLDAELAAREIVVEEEISTASQKLDSSDQPLEPPTVLVLPKETPIPTPQLEVPVGELTAGQSISIQAKLPNLAPRIYVKLWLRDRQSRTLLDGPRWLVDFAPNGLGALATSLSLTVPFGCLEVQFEAIAVEMATQRESHKVTLDRLIVPPDLPALSLDELDI